ncbi:MAG: EAL domain-containing protein [Thermoanaerobaculales bacterium]|nr:EAL domain-containing protein [Thermoanaerobaculales bacterium]
MEALQYRANLFDPVTQLPTLPVSLDGVRKLLEQSGSLKVFLVSFEQEKNLESLVGWERYDDILSGVARHISGLLVDHNNKWGNLLCQENVRGDTFLAFCSGHQEGVNLLDGLVEDLTVFDKEGKNPVSLPFRIGGGTIFRRPAQRVERCIYGGILEARDDFHRRGKRLDEVRRTEVRSMLRDRTIRTLFQPIFRLPEREMIGYEALSRGPRDTYMELPENLFGFSERVGLLGEVELLCIEAALANGHALSDDCVLFLNLSITGLEYIEAMTEGFSTKVVKAGWRPERIVLEITERTYAENPDLLSSIVGSLRGDGFRIAIDDMGTGYSSLHVVADLRPDFIKLDQLLVRELAASPIKQNLVSAVIRFAEGSHSEVIAEGVEREDEAQVLTSLGIRLVQGFLFGYPKPASEY